MVSVAFIVIVVILDIVVVDVVAVVVVVILPLLNYEKDGCTKSGYLGGSFGGFRALSGSREGDRWLMHHPWRVTG